MRQRFGVLAVVGLAGLLVGGAGGALAGRTVLSAAKAVSATHQKASSSELNQTIALIRSNYYASNLDYSKLDRGSANGVVQALGDPYSYYLDPAQARAAEGSQASQQGEVGLYLSSSDCPARPLVSGVAPSSPAEQQGLMQGDVVISIDGVDTDHLSVEQAANRIRGQAGTTVVLDVQRAGRSFNVALMRTSAAPPSVRMASLGDGVLYLRINQFDPSTTTAFHAELQAGLGGAHAIVLDLRNNPGGLVGTADSVISEFVPSGVAFALQSRSREPSLVPVSGHPTTALPLVVLVNSATASAAEMVAGSLAFHRRARLVGTRTFGKDSVQEDFHLSDGADLHLTVRRWFLPDGRSVAGGGLQPDQEVSLSDPANMFDPARLSQRQRQDSQLSRALDLLSPLESRQ